MAMVIVWSLLMIVPAAVLWDICRMRKLEWFVRTALVLASIVSLAWLSYVLLIELWRDL